MTCALPGEGGVLVRRSATEHARTGRPRSEREAQLSRKLPECSWRHTTS